MADTTFFDAANDLICTKEKIRLEINEEHDFDHCNVDSKGHPQSNEESMSSSVDLLFSIIAPPVQKCEAHILTNINTENELQLSVSSPQQKTSSVKDACVHSNHTKEQRILYQQHSATGIMLQPQDDILLIAARRRRRHDKHDDARREFAKIKYGVTKDFDKNAVTCLGNNEEVRIHEAIPLAFECFDAFRKEVYDFTEKQKTNVKEGQLLPSNELQAFAARVEYVYRHHLGVGEKFDDTNKSISIHKDQSSAAALMKTKQVIESFVKRCKRHDFTIEKLQLFSNLLYKNQHQQQPARRNPSKDEERKVLCKFKYWTCKLCGKSGLLFERRTCLVCGRPKIFHPLSPGRLMVTKNNGGGLDVRRSSYPLREEKFVLADVDAFGSSAENLNQEKVDERIQRQYLYKKVDFDSEVRTALRNEVKDLLGSINESIIASTPANC